MPQLLAVHGAWDTGKTTTCLRLAKYFQFDGIKVASLTFEKGTNDVGLYWAEKNHHYCLPLECAKGVSDLEQWLPVGYDLYILEGKNPGAGIMSRMFFDIFPADMQNICIPQHEFNRMDTYNAHPIITMCHPANVPLGYPATDVYETLFDPERLQRIDIDPKMCLPRLPGKILATGYFPSEFWDIYPDIRWTLDIEDFFYLYEERKPDMLLIGWVNDPQTWSEIIHIDIPCLIFDPRLWKENLTEFETTTPSENELRQTEIIVKKDPVGTLFTNSGYLKKYRNPYWTQMFFQELPIISRDENKIIVNGWVHPSYLIRDQIIPMNREKSVADCSPQPPYRPPNTRRR